MHDPAKRRASQRRGREKGCWVYIPQEVLTRAGIPPDAPPPYNRVWPGRKRTVLVQLYDEQ